MTYTQNPLFLISFHEEFSEFPPVMSRVASLKTRCLNYRFIFRTDCFLFNWKKKTNFHVRRHKPEFNIKSYCSPLLSCLCAEMRLQS